MTIKTRLENIEKSVKTNTALDLPILTLLKVENWNYEIGEKNPITLQEWKVYRERTLRNSEDKEKTNAELDELEDKIRSQNGFMEIEFVEAKI